MSARDHATRLVAIRVVKDIVAAAEKDAREALAVEMLAGERTSAAVIGDDGEPVLVGAVTKSKPGKETAAATVTDPQALAEWALREYPTEVVTTTTIRNHEAAIKVLHAHAPELLVETKDVRAAWLPILLGHVAEGTMDVPPGVVVSTVPGAKSTLRVLPESNARDVIAEAVQDGRMTLADITRPALPAGES